MLHGLVGRAGFEQHLDHFFIGAAVQRAFERADAGGGGGINVGRVAATTRAAKVEAFSS